MKLKSISVSLSGRKSKGILVAEARMIVERRSKEIGSRANFRVDPRSRITSSRRADKSSSDSRNGKADVVSGTVRLNGPRLLFHDSVSNLVFSWEASLVSHIIR